MVTMVQTLFWGVQLGKNMVRGRSSSMGVTSSPRFPLP